MLGLDRKVPRSRPARVDRIRGLRSGASGALVLVSVFALGACGDALGESDDGGVRMIPAPGAEMPAEVSAEMPSEMPAGSSAEPSMEPGAAEEGSSDGTGDAVSATDEVAAAPTPAPTERTASAGRDGPTPVRAAPGTAPDRADRVDGGEPTGTRRPYADPGGDASDLEPAVDDATTPDRGGMTLHFGPDAPEPPLAVPAGATLAAVMETALSTEDHRAGDPFRARLDDDLIDAGGLVLLPRGTVVRGRVVESSESPASDRPAVLALVAEEVVVDGRVHRISATIVELESTTEARPGAGETAAKVGVGAAAGAVLGKLLGGRDRDALKGAAAGAAAGAAVALATRDGHARVAEGARLVLRLDRPLLLEPGAAGGGR